MEDNNFRRSRDLRHIFDGAVLKLEAMVVKERIAEYAAQEILQTLINELMEYGWDTPDEALRDNQGFPFVEQAFENCGVKLEVE